MGHVGGSEIIMEDKFTYYGNKVPFSPGLLVKKRWAGNMQYDPLLIIMEYL